MRNFQEVSTLDREEFLSQNIEALDAVNKQLAKLSLRKEELTQAIISAFGHQREGQHTYPFHSWKVEIKTPFIYSLNKKLYELHGDKLPDEFNPISTSVSYSIDKRLCDAYIEQAPEDVKNVLISLIDKKPGKATVSIKEKV